MSAVVVEIEKVDKRDRIVVRCGYSARDAVKRIPGRTWSPSLNCWTLPVSMSSCYALRTEFGEALQIGPVLKDWAITDTCWRTEQMNRRADLTGEAIGDTEGGLKGYQKMAVNFLLGSGSGAILADDQGLGKCATTVTAIAVRNLFPAMIICPKSVIPTWVREIAKWSNIPADRVIVASDGPAKQRKAYEAVKNGDADILITNYEAVKAHTKFVSYGATKMPEKEKEPKEANEIDWAVVVADEAHRLRDPGTQLTRSVKGVSRDAQYRFALTGTPIENTPDELWSILNFVAPDEFPARTKYIDRYLNSSPGFWGGLDIHGLNPRTEHEFRQLTEVRMLRRTKALVLPHLPQKVRSTRYGTLSPQERKAYNELRKDMIATLEDGTDLVVFNPMVKFGRLLQMASGLVMLDPTWVPPTNEPDKLPPLIYTGKSAKLDLLDDTLQDLDVGDRSVVVWFKNRSLLSVYEDRLRKADKYSFESIHGGVNLDGRKRAEDNFQAGRAPLILLTIAAGAEGLTLTKGDTAVYAQKDPSSLKMNQSEDRIHRIGSEMHDQINLIELIMGDTVEQDMTDKLEEKGERIEDVLKDRKLLIDFLGG